MAEDDSTWMDWMYRYTMFLVCEGRITTAEILQLDGLRAAQKLIRLSHDVERLSPALAGDILAVVLELLENQRQSLARGGHSPKIGDALREFYKDHPLNPARTDFIAYYRARIAAGDKPRTASTRTRRAYADVPKPTADRWITKARGSE